MARFDAFRGANITLPMGTIEAAEWALYRDAAYEHLAAGEWRELGLALKHTREIIPLDPCGTDQGLWVDTKSGGGHQTLIVTHRSTYRHSR